MFAAKNPTPVRGKVQHDPTLAVLSGVELLVRAFERGELKIDGETHARLAYIARDFSAMKAQQAATLAAITARLSRV